MMNNVMVSSFTKLSSYSIKRPYKLHRLDKGPPAESTVTTEEALKLLEVMLGTRRLETVTGELYTQKLVRGFCHLYSGQEAVGTGILAAMRKTDSLITSYRCHGFPYLMGWGAHGVLAELGGRVAGCSRGKGGSMHMYGTNFYGGNGIVGAQVPLGTGIAFAHKYKNDGGVSFAMYGDGASNQGQVFEAYNLAMLMKLPVVYVCENNKYGMGTAAHRSSYNSNYYTRGDYVPGIWVDGMDVLAVRDAAKFAIEYANGKGPIILETETYRYFGHSVSDPGVSYRPREEVQEVRKTRDPITTFRKKVLESGIVNEEQIKGIQAKLGKEFDDAVDRMKKDPFPDVKELTADLYVTCLEPDKSIRGVRPNSGWKHFNTHHKMPS